VEEYLERLEELRRKNEVGDEAYKRLKAEYEGKLREIKGGTETEVKAGNTEILEGTMVKEEG
jgi:hypothetical protein